MAGKKLPGGKSAPKRGEQKTGFAKAKNAGEYAEERGMQRLRVRRDTTKKARKGKK